MASVVDTTPREQSHHYVGVGVGVGVHVGVGVSSWIYTLSGYTNRIINILCCLDLLGHIFL